MFALDLGIHDESARTIIRQTNDFSEIPKRLEEAETIFMNEISDVLITIHKEYDLLTERRRRYKEICDALDENALLNQSNRAGANIVKINCGGKNIDIGLSSHCPSNRLLTLVHNHLSHVLNVVLYDRTSNPLTNTRVESSFRHVVR